MSAAARCRRLMAPAQLAIGRCRWSSGAAAAELPSLKAALRAVYRQVHPDLFHDHQAAKEANTKSFKMLHEYLDAARTGSKVPLPYRFHFYVRGSTGAAAAAAGQYQLAAPAAAVAAEAAAPGTAPGSAPAGLREVVLTLPPPTRGAPGEAMSGSTRKAFGSLLAALGLPSRFGGAGGEEEDAGREHSRFVSLRDFLPRAVEAVHQNAAAQSSAQHQLAALRTALRLGRGVTAGFGGPAASAGVLAQLPLLQRLVGALDSLPPSLDLSGLRLMVGQASGVDALGTVWLAAGDSQAAWARHLGGVDAGHCRRRQQLLAQVKAQEAAVAAALGLAMVYPQLAEARLAPEYRHALERLAAAAAARGPAGGGRFRELPLMLAPHAVSAAGEGGAAAAGSSSGGGSSGGGQAASGGGGGELGGCAADGAAGLLVAPLGVTGDQLYSAVQQLGGQVLSAAAAARRRQQELEALRKQVERKVMLRRLLRDPAVADSRYRSCMDRMLAHAQKLSGLLHGQAVRVADINALSPDKSVIDIAWDWRM